MISQPFLLLLALSYVVVLVVVAWWAERHPDWHRRVHPYIYTLTLAVYCSSWTYFGAVGSAARDAWSYLPIYLGPILLFVFGLPIIKKLVLVGVRQKTTSIADFIGTRYGKRQNLAGLVALVAVIGSMPYIALQLKAVAVAWDNLASTPGQELIGGYQIDNALVTAILMAIFSMVFGTRHIEGRERNRGMMGALAVESLVKLIALIVIAGLALVIAAEMDSVSLTRQASVLQPWLENPIDTRFVTATLIAFLAIICLPRQFHVMVVEFQDERDLQKAPWLFPLYLLIISAVVLPITLVGQQLFSGTSIAPDTYVLQLPMLTEHAGLTMLAFIGGFSAATGMVIVAAVTLSIMISNEIVVPLLLRFGQKRFRQATFLGKYLRWIRRSSILILMLGAWFMTQMLARTQGLASIGLISFACFAQLAPALIGGIYWRRGHALGVYIGLAVGFVFWSYCLLMPSLLAQDHSLLTAGPWGLSWLRPENLFGLGFLDPLSHGVFWSLSTNLALYVAISLWIAPSERDSFQAEAFVIEPAYRPYGSDDFEPSSLQVGRLRLLLEPFMSPEQHASFWKSCEGRYRQRLLDNDRAPEFVVRRIEQSLAAIVGAASAQSAINLLERMEPLQFSDLAAIVGDTSEQLKFNQDLLQSTVETITQGICVVDAQLKLVAWNRRYEQLFDYPPRLLYVGCPIESVYRFNAERGLYRDNEDQEQQIARRLELLRSGGSHRFERILPNGTTVQVVGNPMPNGGFVTTYTDISDYKAALAALEEAKITLEERVQQRTADLSRANQALAEENQLRAQAESEVRDINASKSRFMQAASHDLLQPISAARLFTAALQQQLNNNACTELNPMSLQEQLCHVEQSLDTTEQLISALREIARLESGKLVPNRKHFNINQVLEELAVEFAAIANNKGIGLHFVPSKAWVNSDPQLVRRILQNFLSNAIHYTKRGKLILGCRRRANGLEVQVWDTGPGISEQAQAIIFNEFERLSPGTTSADKGLGLGLTIAKRMADLLEHDIRLESEPGQGSMFSLKIDYGVPENQTEPVKQAPLTITPELRGAQVLCIDNEPNILAGMKTLLSGWGCIVKVAEGREQLMQLDLQESPDILLVDYHLEEHLTGLELIATLPDSWQQLPCIIISADNSTSLKTKVKAAGYAYLGKPVAPEELSQKMTTLLKKSDGEAVTH